MHFSVHNPQWGGQKDLARKPELASVMNYLDIVLIVPLLWAGYRGFKKGFILEIFSLLALVAGIYAGIHFSDAVAGWLSGWLDIRSDYLPVVSFAVTFIGVVVGVHFLGKALSGVVKAAALGGVNRALGAVFSIAKVAIVTGIVIYLFHGFDNRMGLLKPEMKEGSLLYGLYIETALTVLPALEESDTFDRFEKWRKEEERPTMPWEQLPEVFIPPSLRPWHPNGFQATA